MLVEDEVKVRLLTDINNGHGDFQNVRNTESLVVEESAYSKISKETITELSVNDETFKEEEEANKTSKSEKDEECKFSSHPGDTSCNETNKHHITYEENDNESLLEG